MPDRITDNDSTVQAEAVHGYLPRVARRDGVENSEQHEHQSDAPETWEGSDRLAG